MSDVTGIYMQDLLCCVPVIADLVVVAVAITGFACLVFRRILRSLFTFGDGPIDLLLSQLVVLLNRSGHFQYWATFHAIAFDALSMRESCLHYLGWGYFATVVHKRTSKVVSGLSCLHVLVWDTFDLGLLLCLLVATIALLLLIVLLLAGISPLEEIRWTSLVENQVVLLFQFVACFILMVFSLLRRLLVSAKGWFSVVLLHIFHHLCILRWHFRLLLLISHADMLYLAWFAGLLVDVHPLWIVWPWIWLAAWITCTWLQKEFLWVLEAPSHILFGQVFLHFWSLVVPTLIDLMILSNGFLVFVIMREELSGCD